MVKIKCSNRQASKIKRRLEKIFPGTLKSYNMDLMQKYYDIDIKKKRNKSYPSHSAHISGGLSRDVYLILRDDIIRVNNTKKPRVYKYYKKLQKALKEGNIKVANNIIQDIYTNGCYFSYEFSKFIRTEFLNAIKREYKDFDSQLALNLIKQVSYKTELEIISNLSRIYHENKKELNFYLKQVIMEIKLSEKGRKKLCVDYEDFSI